MKIVGKVAKKSNGLYALIEGHKIKIERSKDIKGISKRESGVYDKIYDELTEGENVFVDYNKRNSGALVTCFNHGEEEWFRQRVINPMDINKEKLTPYQKRVLDQTEKKIIVSQY